MTDNEVTSAQPGCAHHWKVATPEEGSGLVSIGLCLKCKEQRTFANYIDVNAFGTEIAYGEKPKRVRGRPQTSA